MLLLLGQSLGIVVFLAFHFSLHFEISFLRAVAGGILLLVTRANQPTLSLACLLTGEIMNEKDRDS